jgi:hypothetical protein
MEAPLDLEINELLAGSTAMRAITGDIAANSGLGMVSRSIVHYPRLEKAVIVRSERSSEVCRWCEAVGTSA